jgi:hypothetical protein
MTDTAPQRSDVNYHPIMPVTALWAQFAAQLRAEAVQLEGHRERRRRELAHDSARREGKS